MIVKNNTYKDMSNIHILIPAEIETGDAWNAQTIELVQEIAKALS